MRPRLVCLLLAFTLLLAGTGTAQAFEETAHTYTGTIGTAPIVMELSFFSDDTVASGRYFYTRHHLDLMLETAQSTAGHVVLMEGAGKARPRIALDRQPGGSWRGTWRDAKGRTLPVALVPARLAPPAATAPDYLRALATRNPYDYRRLAGLKLVAGRRETFMGHTLQWSREPVSGITLFEIADGYPEAGRARINQALTDRLWREVNSWFVCKDNHFGEGDYTQTVTPRLLTPDLVSVSVFTSYYCGGAHPDFADVPINLDAHTAAPLTLEDVLWVGKGAPMHYARMPDGGLAPGSAGFERWAGYRKERFAPWLLAQWHALYPDKMQPDGKGGCDYTDADVWQTGSWYMTPAGVFIAPSFVRVARACETRDDWSILPWRIVRQHPGWLALKLPE